MSKDSSCSNQSLLDGGDIESLSDHIETRDEAGDKCEDLNLLLTEEIPLIGRVPLLLFVPECKEATALRKQIHQFGGICIYIVECCSYQIYPERQDEDRDEVHLKESFSKGAIISSNWIVESIAS